MHPKQDMNLTHVVSFLATCILALFLGSLAPNVQAQENNLTVPETGEAQGLQDDVFAAPVVVDGETLFFVRGFSALPATERAAKVEERILEIAELPDFVELEFSAVEPQVFGVVVVCLPLT